MRVQDVQIEQEGNDPHFTPWLQANFHVIKGLTLDNEREYNLSNVHLSTTPDKNCQPSP